MDGQRFGARSDRSEAAFQRGRELLAAGDRDGAEEQFAAAAELDAVDMPWRITQAYLEAFDARAAVWMRRAAASLSRPGGITVDPGTLPITTVRGEGHEHLSGQVWGVALTHCDPRAGAAALRAAHPSIGHATRDGRVPPESEVPLAPYYANSSRIDEAKLEVRLDAKDQVMPMLARVVLTVLVEELERAGAARARLHTPRSAWPLY
ncbi:hypothetical protein AB0M29_18205 [Streptomyces sp. NPDC051976]|uniref:hypothetical protein n=1 Tax=Streptomyces sp. NPDC051976 TaxID=3154947 RepID=UPI00341C08E9